MPQIRRAARLGGVVLLAAAGAVSAAPAVASASPGSSQDRTWLVDAHQSHLAEIAAAADARRSAKSPQVRRIAERIEADHRRLDESVRLLAQRFEVPLPDEPSWAQQRALADLRENSGAAYDDAWLTAQAEAHRDALDAAGEQVAEGSAADVVSAARAAQPVIREHLRMLEAAGAGLEVPADKGDPPAVVEGGTGGQAAAGSRRVLAAGLTGAGVIVLALTAVVLRRRAGP